MQAKGYSVYPPARILHAQSKPTPNEEPIAMPDNVTEQPLPLAFPPGPIPRYSRRRRRGVSPELLDVLRAERIAREWWSNPEPVSTVRYRTD